MHVLIDPPTAPALVGILGQLTVRAVHREIAQRDERRPLDRKHVRIATISVITATRAWRIRIEFQNARTICRTRQGQARDHDPIFADLQGAVMREASGIVAEQQMQM